MKMDERITRGANISIAATVLTSSFWSMLNRFDIPLYNNVIIINNQFIYQFFINEMQPTYVRLAKKYVVTNFASNAKSQEKHIRQR